MLETVLRFGDVAGIVALVAFVIVRQFLWRDAEPKSMLRLPLALTAGGGAWVIYTFLREPSSTGSIIALLVELIIVAATGAVMARFTQFRAHDDRRQYRLLPWAVLLWAAFALIRAAGFYLAQRLGISDDIAEPALILALGLNRLTCAALVRRGVMSPRWQ